MIITCLYITPSTDPNEIKAKTLRDHFENADVSKMARFPGYITPSGYALLHLMK